MIFRIGSVPDAPDFFPDDDPEWRPIRQPKIGIFQVIAVPIGLLAAAAIAVLWISVTPLEGIRVSLSLPGFLLLIAAVLVLHEFAHVLPHPCAGLSQKSVIGWWPSRMLFYAGYTGELRRNRYLAIGVCPLVVISIFPLLIAATLRISLPWGAIVSIVNAFIACGDILIMGMILVQVPASAIIRNKGWCTYWRHDSAYQAHGE